MSVALVEKNMEREYDSRGLSGGVGGHHVEWPRPANGVSPPLPSGEAA